MMTSSTSVTTIGNVKEEEEEVESAEEETEEAEAEAEAEAEEAVEEATEENEIVELDLFLFFIFVLCGPL